MPLLGVSLNAALLFLVPVSARPLKSRVLDPVAVPYAYLSLSQLNLTNPISSPNPPAEHVLCFNTKPSLNLTLVAEDCSTVLNDIILRLDEPYKKWPFSGQKYVTSHGPWIPSRWIVRQCTVFVNSARSASIDVFTLFEVAMTANKILSDCVTSDRKRQGGLMPIGLRELSYCVWLQGDGPGVDFNAINNAGTLAIPDFELSKRAQDAKRAVRGLTEIQLRTLDSSGALISLNEAVSPSNFTEDLNAKIDHEIDCFPARSILPDANADDCRFIINNIILGMKDPLREQTWGYTDTVDINLSLPESRWTFEDCFIQVKNLDERTVDRFRPVDVAEVAQNILQKCVTDTKKPLGGNADVGQLEFPLRFYVVLSGTLRGSGESVGNDTMLFHSSSGPRTLESRATLNSPEANPLRMIPTEGLTAGKRYPVHCFDPSSAHALMPAIRSDCDVIISEVILRLPNPMKEQSFGYTDAADINLSETEYNNWNYGQCVVFIRNIDHHTRQDRFRFLDVAYTAQRIMNQCLDGSKHAIGGIADVGTIDDNFYVGLSGFDSRSLRNGTSLDTKPANLNKRSSTITKLVQARYEFAPTVRCFRPGMPAARKIEMQDCTDAAMILLSDPKIFVPQPFTTEPTGGIKMPFVQHNKSCYLMMDTSLNLSVSDSIALLKMVYWALEIMLTCISGREQGFGGTSRLDKDKGIFVSVTGVDPAGVGNGLAGLRGESTSAIVLENTSLQIVDLGHI